MTEKRVTVKELEEGTDISYQSIRRYLRGRGTPNIDFLTLMADYLEVSTDYLLGRTEEMNRW